MASRVLVVFESGKYKARTSNAETLDFLSIKLGASALEIKQTGSDFDFSGKKLQNIADGIASSDASSKGQMDTADGLRVLKAGDTMTGALDFGGTQKVTGLAAPTAANDAARKTYVDTADGLRVLKAGDTMSGNLDMGNNSVLNVAAPVGASDAANKSYVDSLVSGLDVKPSVRATTTAALPACTYANGTSGVGATLTENANGALPAQDGVTLVVNDRVLVRNQASAFQNGIYVVTQVGSAGAPFILTRATDSDQAAEVSPGMFTFIEEGTAFADTGWICTVQGSVTIGTTALPFSQFSSAGVITAGSGLTQTGNVFSVVVDNVTIEINGNALRVKDAGITAAKLGANSVSAVKLNADVAGEGIRLNSGTNAIERNDSRNFTNDNAGAITVRQVVYVKANGNVDKARADVASLGDFMLGLVEAASIASAGSGAVLVRPGAIQDGFSSLVPGSNYYVDPTTAGSLTATAPSASGQSVYSVGRAISATEILLDPKFIIEIA